MLLLSTMTVATHGNEAMDAIANFITMDMLKEELAVVEHYLETLPETPFTASRRTGLSEKKDQLVQMIERMSPTEDGSAGRDSSDDNTPSSQTPALLAVPFSGNGAHISGFSTPDIFSSHQEIPFASVVEESLYDDEARFAQEIAYPSRSSRINSSSDWEFAQLIAHQLNDIDDHDDEQENELERQRRAQIEAYVFLSVDLCFKFTDVRQ